MAKKSKSKSKPNGFQCFMHDMKSKNPGIRAKCRTMELLVKHCDPLWRNLSDDEKAKYNEEAKIKANLKKNKEISLEELNKTHNLNIKGSNTDLNAKERILSEHQTIAVL